MGLMKPTWRRKIRRVGDELVISIPSELKHCFEGVNNVILTIEGDKIVIFAERDGGVSNG
ncbi:AbrB/MazE/SpoVT family DNA-binding domain-containing protein [Archaeoglobus profundus]|uniref:SpoVT-AbrB domain-containing protein n=1 Tax=Archaeoglobus profundus (strain DSM 5631 / JCM 9629 / NBRC 100127 / Av18) TaxID=572546 RepID=D2RF49_ARCPA|nr:hypothetical protein [Archaeoglobus profundus]ADB58743.1 hypothetical protein Arcpr_1697 [Archaeoglobus profundus DSM 5631]